MSQTVKQPEAWDFFPQTESAEMKNEMREKGSNLNFYRV
jgi:hypothetical protein